MLTDIKSASEMEWPVIVIGAGVAGNVVARKLEKSGVPCLLVELGGAELDDKSWDTYKVINTGNFPYDTYATRLPFFGGTSGHWGGQCSLINERSYSGFLDPYYDEVLPLLRLNRNFEQFKVAASAVNDSRSHPHYFNKQYFMQGGPPIRFKDERNKVVDSASIFLLENCRVEAIVRKNGSDDRFTLQTQDMKTGRKYNLNPDRIVVATGGIEASRLILNSAAAAPQDIFSNENVGRGFYDHLGLWETIKVYTNRRDFWEQYRWQRMDDGNTHHWAMRAFCPSRAALAEANIPFCGIVNPRHSSIVLENTNEALKAYYAGEVNFLLWVSNLQEDMASIKLSRERDSFGMPKCELKYDLTEHTFAYTREAVRLISEAIFRSTDDLVYVDENTLNNLSPKNYGLAAHHMGGLVMSSNKQKGVVDENAVIHGSRNIYVASSAVFPTTDITNPTLHIAALSAKIADEITKKAKR